MRDTGHPETVDHAELVWRHERAEALLAEAVAEGRPDETIDHLEAVERRYRNERVRRAFERRP